MATLLSASFIFFAIFMRILIQYFYTGDHGVRLAKLDAPLIEKIPGTIFILSFIVSLILVALKQYQQLQVGDYFSTKTSILIGLLGFVGILITVVSQIQMGKSWRIGVDQDEKTDLKISGLYAKSRNPIYFGILLYWIAISLSFLHPAMWVCALVSWASIETIVRKVEEPYLRRVHGEVFESYCRRSNRYLIW